MSITSTFRMSTPAPAYLLQPAQLHPLVANPAHSNIFQLSKMQSLNAANSPRARVQSCPVLLARLGRKHQVVGVGDLPKHVDYSAKNPAIFLAQHRAKVQSLSRLKERPVSTGHLIGYLSYCTLKKLQYIYIYIYIYLSIYLFSLSLSPSLSPRVHIYIHYTIMY